MQILEFVFLVTGMFALSLQTIKIGYVALIHWNCVTERVKREMEGTIAALTLVIRSIMQYYTPAALLVIWWL